MIDWLIDLLRYLADSRDESFLVYSESVLLEQISSWGRKFPTLQPVHGIHIVFHPHFVFTSILFLPPFCFHLHFVLDANFVIAFLLSPVPIDFYFVMTSIFSWRSFCFDLPFVLTFLLFWPSFCFDLPIILTFLLFWPSFCFYLPFAMTFVMTSILFISSFCFDLPFVLSFLLFWSSFCFDHYVLIFNLFIFCRPL